MSREYDDQYDPCPDCRADLAHKQHRETCPQYPFVRKAVLSAEGLQDAFVNASTRLNARGERIIK